MTARNWLGKNGAWSDPSQWGGSLLPGPLDIAQFGTGTYAVQFATNATVQQIAGNNLNATLNLQAGTLTLGGVSNNDGSWSGTIAQSGGVFVPANGAFFVSGILNQSAGTIAPSSGQFTVNGTLTQTGGTITADAASRVTVQNSATLGGEVSGSGTLAVGGTVTLGGADLTIGSVQMGSTGTIVLASDLNYAGDFMPAFGKFALGGHDFTLSGRSQIGAIGMLGSGTLAVTGSTVFSGLNLDQNFGQTVNSGIVDAGFIAQDAPLSLPSGASTGSIIVAANGVYDLVADRGISGTASDFISNAGLFEKTAGVVGLNSNIQVPIINTGTLRSTTGMLLLTGQSNVLGGTLDGGGTIWVGGTAELPVNAAVNVWQFGVGFGALLQLDSSILIGGNVEATADSTLALRGNTLGTQGQGALKGTIQAQGTASSVGSLLVGGIYDVGGLIATGGSLWLEDKGMMVQNGAAIVLGGSATDQVTLRIDPFALYDITTSQAQGNGPGLIGTFGTAAIINEGTFENFGGGATVGVPFTNESSGRVANAYGTLSFTQGFINDGEMALGGTVTINGGLNSSAGQAGRLLIEPGGTVSISGSVNAGSTIDFQDATDGVLLLKSASSFAGTVDHFTAGQTIDLANAKANKVTRTGGAYSFFQVTNSTSVLVASVTLANPPATVVITGDGNGGTEILAASPGHVFAGLLTAGTNVNWAGGTISGDWNTATNWSTGAIPTAVDAVTFGNLGTVVYGPGAAGGTIQSLNGTGIELDLTAGSLVVDNGGTWIGGSFIETGGNFDSVTGYIFSGTAFTQAAGGRLTSDNGTLAINNFGTFAAAGTLTGSGAIQIGGVVNFDAAAQIDVGTLDIRREAIFNGSTTLAGGFLLEGSVILQGSTLTLTGSAVLGGGMIDPGTIAIAAGATADVTNFHLGTGDVLSVAGYAFQGQFSTLLTGDVIGTANGGIAILQGGTYNLERDGSIFLTVVNGALNNGFVFNAGLLEKVGGSGTSVIDANFVSTGTIMVASGTLIQSAGQLDASGTITGNGILNTANGGSITSLTLEPGTFINIAQLILGNTQLDGDQTDLSVVNSTGTLALQGNTFTLGGSAELDGTVTGGGQVLLSHQGDLGDNINGFTVAGLGTVVRISGSITQSGNIALGTSAADSVSIEVTSTGVLNDLVDGGIFAKFGAVLVGAVSNAGVIEKTGGSGVTTIVANITNTGTIIDGHATLTLSGPVLNDGLMTVAGVMIANGSIGADVSANGRIKLGGAGTLIANASIAASQTVALDPGGFLQIARLSDFAGTIEGFTQGDRIELLNTTSVASVTYTGSAIQVNGTTGVLGTIAANILNPSLLTVSTDGTNTYIADTFGRELSWTETGNSSFGVASNWSDLTHGITPALTPPAAADTVAFDTASGVVFGSGSVAAVDVGTSGFGSLRLGSGAALFTGALDAGFAVAAAGQISVSGTGTELVVTGQAAIGDGGTGLLSVLSGGAVSTGGLTLGARVGGSGTVTVAGPPNGGASLSNVGQLAIGGSGEGSFSVLSGGTATTAPGVGSVLPGAVVADTSSASGSWANVSGSKSTWQVGGSLLVGNGGFGSLSVAQGATVTAGSLDLAAEASGQGVVSVVGVGSTLSLTGSLIVGDQSTGDMSILSGAQVAIGGGLIGGTGGGASGNLDIEGAGSHLTINGGTLVVGATGPAVYTLGQGTTQTGAERTAVFGIANLGGLQDPPYITNDSNQSTLNSGYVGEADIAVRNSGTYTVKPQSGTFAPPTVYTPDITFDPDPNTNGGSVNGVWVIQNQGTLVLNATTVDASQTIDFAGINAAKLVIGQAPETNGTLDVDNAFIIDGSIAPGSPNVLPGFSAPIQNYQSGDVIVLRGLSYGSATASGDVVTVWSGAGGTGNQLGSLVFLDKKGNDTTPTAVAEALAASVQLTAAAVACFVEGTRIATADGAVAVEELKPGDEVLTSDGAAEPIVWLGSRDVGCKSHPKPETVWPVRIARGAFGRSVPTRELYLSPDHAVFINDVLVPVKLLINGTSIAQVKRDRVTYFHVELPDHRVILAEGLGVESYLDLDDRWNFASDGEPIRLFPDFAVRFMSDAAATWETKGAAPLVMAGPRLERARRSITSPSSRHPRTAARR